MKNFFIIHLKFTKNNIYCTVSNTLSGSTLITLSSGNIGFINAQKRTEIACTTIILKLTAWLFKKKVTGINLVFDGGLRWLKKAVKLFKKEKILIFKLSIKDRTSHNGCKKKKQRRV